jgi:hypothetical protein
MRTGIPVNRVEDAVLRGFDDGSCAPGVKHAAAAAHENYVGAYIWKVPAVLAVFVERYLVFHLKDIYVYAFINSCIQGRAVGDGWARVCIAYTNTPTRTQKFTIQGRAMFRHYLGRVISQHWYFFLFFIFIQGRAMFRCYLGCVNSQWNKQCSVINNRV